MSAESMQLQTVCDGGPEGISQGCAHAPLMMQEGLCLLCSHPHIPHLPAYPRVTKRHVNGILNGVQVFGNAKACRQCLAWLCQHITSVLGILMPVHSNCAQ